MISNKAISIQFEAIIVGFFFNYSHCTTATESDQIPGFGWEFDFSSVELADMYFCWFKHLLAIISACLIV